MGLADIVILLVITLLTAGGVYASIQKKKRGSGCGCDCSGCPGCGAKKKEAGR